MLPAATPGTHRSSSSRGRSSTITSPSSPRSGQAAWLRPAYTIVTDVTTRPMTRGDLTPAYWFSENMKYFYLLFADSPRFDYRDNYLSTEGKVFIGLRPATR